MVSSVGHAYGGVNLAAPGYLNEEKNYMKWNAYAQSKSANMLYALSLSKKLESKGIKAFSLHPGIIESPLWRFLEKEGKLLTILGASLEWASMRVGRNSTP